jgi:2-polyprenyl-3-methyl-5-hydroxy-6-metoxy-1,4-benzoquinol methylase
MTHQLDRTPGMQAKYLHVQSLAPEESALHASWDTNVDSRADELANHRDRAYADLTELLLGLLAERIPADGSILDAGCGLGYMANSMVAAGYRVEGVDPSRLSIDYAKKSFGNIEFSAQTIEQYASDCAHASRHDAVVANMVLHTTPQLHAFVASSAKALKKEGSFIASIPHPFFFISTKESVSIPLDYSVTRGFAIPFRINGGRTHPAPVPYFQRTLADYSEALHRAGISDLRIREPQRVGHGRCYDILAIFASRK